MAIINSRADLDALRGTAAYAQALLALYGSTQVWANKAAAGSAPNWQLVTDLSTIQAMGFSTQAELLAVMAVAGVATPASPPMPTAPSAAQTAQVQYAAALAAGLTITWSASASLNGTYPLQTDPLTGAPIQTEILGELASINQDGTFTNGQATRGWPTMSGTYPSFTVAQFKLFASTIALYLDQVAAALGATLAGQSPAWPSASVTVTG